MLYLLLTFLHIVFAMIWVGGVVMMTAFSVLLLRTSDRAFLTPLTRYSVLVSARTTGPAAGLTILTGFAAVGVGHTGFPFWVVWGIATFIIAVAVGAVVFRRAGMEFARLLAQPDADEQAVRAGQRRMAVQQVFMVVLLLAAVWAMVFKPTL
jgi:uncharacterized membrane protein